MSLLKYVDVGAIQDIFFWKSNKKTIYDVPT